MKHPQSSTLAMTHHSQAGGPDIVLDMLHSNNRTPWILQPGNRFTTPTPVVKCCGVGVDYWIKNPEEKSVFETANKF